MTPASRTPGPSVDGMIWAATASISPALASSKVSKCGVGDSATLCACCRADRTSAQAAIARQVENQCRRVEFMVVVNHDDMLHVALSALKRGCPSGCPEC